MKIEKLELKHLTGYIYPNGLESNKGLIVGTLLPDAVWTEGFPRNIEFIGDVKPILRPLSDLTKEIIHDGEKFVPILKISDPNSERTDKLSISYVVQKPKIGDEISVYDRHLGRVLAVNISNIKVLNYYMVEKLFEWKFDIYGLIDAGLAIDSTTAGNP